MFTTDTREGSSTVGRRRSRTLGLPSLWDVVGGLNLRSVVVLENPGEGRLATLNRQARCCKGKGLREGLSVLLKRAEREIAISILPVTMQP